MSSLHFTQSGLVNAPTFLFLHGFLGSHEDWRMASLTNTFNCLLINLPGHGKSIQLDSDSYRFKNASELIGDIIKQTPQQRCHVIGYSLGGRLALYFALQHPEMVRSLTLLSTSPGLATESERVQRRQDDEKLAQRLETEDIETILRDWYNQPLFTSLANNKELLETTIVRRKQHDPKEWAKALRGLGVGSQPSLWEMLPTVTVPTLLLTGESDSKFIAIAKKMKEKNERFRIETIANAGHALHVEQPTAVADSIREWVLKTEKGI